MPKRPAATVAWKRARPELRSGLWTPRGNIPRRSLPPTAPAAAVAAEWLREDAFVFSTHAWLVGRGFYALAGATENASLPSVRRDY
ncbi:MAG: hypothetical protein NT089_01125 [Planctomycetia bacterium]|nr:hypothetical protein [Planctomycetia bacterium]